MPDSVHPDRPSDSVVPAAKRRAQRAQYRELERRGVEWDRRNPDACPDCKGRPGKADYADEGGGDHSPWCKA